VRISDILREKSAKRTSAVKLEMNSTSISGQSGVGMGNSTICLYLRHEIDANFMSEQILRCLTC